MFIFVTENTKLLFLEPQYKIFFMITNIVLIHSLRFQKKLSLWYVAYKNF